MALKDYVPVMQRYNKFLIDNKENKVLVATEANVNWDKEAAFFKATITINGDIKAIGHAMAPSLGEDKEFEKAETTAVGRALAFLGYEAEDTEAAAADDKEETGKAKRGLGSGKKTTTKKAAKKVEEEDDSDDSDDDENEESDDAEDKDDDSDDAESDEDDEDDAKDDSEDDSDDEDEKAEEKKAKPAASSSLGAIMGKYGLKNKKSEE